MAQTYTVSGRVIDSKTNEGLSGAKATLGGKTATTDSFGSFSIDLTLEDDQTPPSRIRFIKGGYIPKSTSAITQSGKLLQKINVVELKPLKLDFGIELPKLIVFGAPTLSKFKKPKTAPESKAIELALSESSKLYERLIPFAATQLKRFGIDDPSEIENKVCPPFSEINKVISNTNKTTRQLNNSYKSITSLTKGSKLLEGLIKAIQIILQLLKVNPIPTAIGLPPGPAGGILPPPLTKTLGNITSYDSKREFIQRKLESFENILGVFPEAIIPISTALAEATSLIQASDRAVGECLDSARQRVLEELNRQLGIDQLSIQEGVVISDDTVVDIDYTQIDSNVLKDILGIPRDSDLQVGDLLSGNYLQVQLDEELNELTKESASDGQPSVTEYNGFVLSVETETEEQAQGKSIKRRFAVGKNKDGVTLVKGEPSYSSNDQILLDELIFTIESNDLSAN